MGTCQEKAKVWRDGNVSQEGAGLYSNTENVQSAMIETSAVILRLWQCYASLGVWFTPAAHLLK